MNCQIGNYTLKMAHINMDIQKEFFEACKIGDFDKVKSLLLNETVNPEDENNSAIRWASKKGHYNVVKLLLGDNRVKNSLNITQQLKLLEESIDNNERNKDKEIPAKKDEEKITFKINNNMFTFPKMPKSLVIDIGKDGNIKITY